MENGEIKLGTTVNCGRCGSKIKLAKPSDVRTHDTLKEHGFPQTHSRYGRQCRFSTSSRALSFYNQR